MSAFCDTELQKGAVVELDWLPVAAGLLLLCAPTSHDPANSLSIRITCQYCDAAAQAYLPGSSGVLLLMAALTAPLVLDDMLARVIKRSSSA